MVVFLSSLSLLGSHEQSIRVARTESVVQWMPRSYMYQQEYVLHPFDIPVEEQPDPMVEMFVHAIVTGRSDPEAIEILRALLQQEMHSRIPRENIVEKIFWWNSPTKLDPRLANVFFLE